MSRTVPVEARGWKRGFCGSSVTWNRTSPATIYQTNEENDIVEGLAVGLTDAEISALDPYEGYPRVYNRFDVNMVAFVPNQEGVLAEQQIAGQAYIRVKPDEPFTFPCPEYITATCKTIYMSRKLRANGGEVSS